jgi:hypothetical protein
MAESARAAQRLPYAWLGVRAEPAGGGKIMSHPNALVLLKTLWYNGVAGNVFGVPV